MRPFQVAPARAGRKFAQSLIDERHLQRVLFEEEGDGFVIITGRTNCQQAWKLRKLASSCREPCRASCYIKR